MIRLYKIPTGEAVIFEHHLFDTERVSYDIDGNIIIDRNDGTVYDKTKIEDTNVPKCDCYSTPSNPTTGVTLQIDDTVYALCGTKTVINDNEILTIPTQYEYRCSSLTNKGIINNNGIIILN